MDFGFQHWLVLILEVSNTPGHPLTPLYKVFLQQFVCLKLKMKFIVFKEAQCSFLHAQQHANKVYSQPAQSCTCLLENPSKIITLKNAAWNFHYSHVCYKHCSSPQYTISSMLIMFCILLTLQITTKPPINQHIYRIPETQSTMQNFRSSQWCWWMSPVFWDTMPCHLLNIYQFLRVRPLKCHILFTNHYGIIFQKTWTFILNPTPS